MRRRSSCPILLLAASVLLVATTTSPQGETTSAVVGQVSDMTGAAIAGATVTVIGREDGSRRQVKTDNGGRFDFAQLKPGVYSVRAEADGFAAQQNDTVDSGLGQKQTVDFVLHLATAKEIIEVSGDAPL